MENQKGFTLIELMVVVSIIGILAAIALPAFGTYRTRAKISEGYSLARPVMEEIVDYYDHRGVVPPDNTSCGLPAPELIKGKYVQSIEVNDGVIVVRFDPNEVPQAGSILTGDDRNTLTFIPVINLEEPTPVVSWRIGDDAPQQSADQSQKQTPKRKRKR